MLSRMAESLYWIGRCVERAEQTARMTDVTFRHTLALGSTPAAEVLRQRHWQTLLEIVGERSAFASDGAVPDERTVPAHVTFSDANPNSIVLCVAQARENARTMRHQLATEMWEVLNRFHLEVHNPARRRRASSGPEHAIRFCRSVIELSELFQGVTDSTMPREEGWYFLRMGTFLERADKTARALDVNYQLLVDDDVDDLELLMPSESMLDTQPWANVLRSLSAYEAYYKVSNSSVRPGGVIDLLTLSAVVPRSIRFSIANVDAALRHVTEDAPQAGAERATRPDRHSEARREAGRLHSELAYQRLSEIVRIGVHPYLRELQRRCYRIGDAIEDEFFAHRPLTAEQVMA